MKLSVTNRLPREVEWVHHWFCPHDPDNTSMSLGRVGIQNLLHFPNSADFLISACGRSIEICPAEDVSATTIEHLLLDQVLPRVLARLGHIVLHGGAVQVAGRAILFLGDTGRGKSTLTAAMAKRGHPLLGDDGIVVSNREGEITVQPTYPSLRLLPDSIDRLYHVGTPLAPVADYSDKQRVFVPLAQTLATELPLDRIYILDSAKEATSTVTIRRLSPKDVCLALVANRFELDPTDIVQAPRRLQDAAELADRIPVFALSFPRRYDQLDRVCEAILEGRATGGED